MKKICQICKKEFDTTHDGKQRQQKFCGRKCYSIYRKGMPLNKKGIIKNCKFCGKDFYVPQCRKETANFCSYSCSAKANFPYHLITKELICPVCKKTFIHTAHAGKEGKYCSDKCRKYAGYWSGTKILNCIKCGKGFTVNKGQQYKRKYCSKGCRDQNQRDDFVKITQRNGVRRYFQRRNLIKECQNCGYNEHPEILGIHHKDLNPKNYSLDNLIVLCPNCHSLCHNHFINHPCPH